MSVNDCRDVTKINRQRKMWRLWRKSPEGQTVLESSVHLRFLVWRFKRLTFGPGRVFPRIQENKDHDLWSHMVPEVMRDGPGYTFTKESWSHEWWEMVPTCIWMSIPIHWFIDPVDRLRSISTVDKDSPNWDYGRYRRSIRIHLRRNYGRSSMVDLNPR